MSAFVNNKSLILLLIFSIMIINASKSTVFAEKTNGKDINNKLDKGNKLIKEVKITKKLAKNISSFGEVYKEMVKNNTISVNYFCDLEDKSKIDFAEKIIELYSQTNDPEDRQILMELGMMIDNNMGDIEFPSVVFSMRMGGSRPYAEGTRYAVFSKHNALATY